MHLATRFVRFVKATVIGGVFVIAPIALLVYIIGQTFWMAYQVVLPLMQWLPVHSAYGISLAAGGVIGGLVAICFLAGLLAHTTIARWLVQQIETAILANLPGYSLVKSMGEGMVGVDSSGSRKAVLVRFDDHQQIGFLMDSTSDGRLVVFVPNVPSPWSGRLCVVSHDRVEVLSMPIRVVIDRLQRLGLGLGGTLTSDAAASP